MTRTALHSWLHDEPTDEEELDSRALLRAYAHLLEDEQDEDEDEDEENHDFPQYDLRLVDTAAVRAFCRAREDEDSSSPAPVCSTATRTCASATPA